jgi:pyruvate kinase
MKKIKVICTLGPSSFNEETVHKLRDRGADFFRINLSHTPLEEIEEKIQTLKKFNVPIMIDTEGSQIRTGNTEIIRFEEGEVVRIHFKKVDCNQSNLFLTPLSITEKLELGDLIHLDFDSTLIKISNLNLDENYLEGIVLIGGTVGGRKGVHIESDFEIEPFSEKDKKAIELSKKYGINNFSLSFIRKKEDILEFKQLYPQAKFLSKVETRDAVKNIDSILELSDGILIDRGDLSREIPLEKIPFIQKIIIEKSNKKGKDIFIATNTLENMSNSLKPSKSEINDLVSCLVDGVDGFVLTKETAVGKFPVETLNMLANIVKEHQNNSELDLDNLHSNLLIPPHGGKLVNRIIKNKFSKEEINSMKRIIIDEENLMDLEQIAIGSFSPLEGFMDKEDVLSVLKNMKLKDGTFWPIPILLQVENIENIKEGDKVLLVYKKDRNPYGILHLDKIYSLNKEELIHKMFGTNDKENPLVKRFFEKGDFFLSGKIDLIRRISSSNKLYGLTPKQIRQIFSERGWSKVISFNSKIYNFGSSQNTFLSLMKRFFCDGLFFHPNIGRIENNPLEISESLDSYETLIRKFPKGKFFFCTLSLFPKYGGIREVLFNALIRKNFGCSHFIVEKNLVEAKSFEDKLGINIIEK